MAEIKKRVDNISEETGKLKSESSGCGFEMFRVWLCFFYILRTEAPKAFSIKELHQKVRDYAFDAKWKDVANSPKAIDRYRDVLNDISIFYKDKDKDIEISKEMEIIYEQLGGRIIKNDDIKGERTYYFESNVDARDLNLLERYFDKSTNIDPQSPTGRIVNDNNREDTKPFIGIISNTEDREHLRKLYNTLRRFEVKSNNILQKDTWDVFGNQKPKNKENETGFFKNYYDLFRKIEKKDSLWVQDDHESKRIKPMGFVWIRNELYVKYINEEMISGRMGYLKVKEIKPIKKE